MSSKPFKLIIVGLLIVVFLIATWPYQFQHAWQSSYTYALEPIQSIQNIQSTMLQPALNEAKPSIGTLNYESTEPSIPAVKLSERVVDYNIQVSLREEEHMLDGEELITWTNPGKETVTDMYVHLYANAFNSPDSTFMKESGGQLRGDKATDKSEGSIRLLNLETLEGENMLPRVKYISPDDQNNNDYTVATFRLIEPVAPGQSVTLRIKFEVTLPEVFARMGYYEDFVMAGQWFPKIAAYETVGTRNVTKEGWNIHQYHGNSEFYSDFAVYSVKVYAPENYTVAGTGMQTKVANIGQGRKMVQFYAEDVHDFAFAMSPNFITHESSFSHEGVPGVKIKLYLDPTHEQLAERYMHAAKSALAYLGKNYGAYPYSTLSIVVPPSGASGAGGMEYPTFVTTLAADSANPKYELERTVIHEISHQYWYGMVANNEFEEAWLDEAFTSYSEEKIIEDAYGVTSNHRIEASFMTNPAPLQLDSWLYKDHNHYAENVYLRGKLVLLDIEDIVGRDVMSKIMRSYFQTYKFKHPTTQQFQRIVENVTKQSWQSYFDKFVYGNESADLAIQNIESRVFKEQEKTIYEYTILLDQNSGISRSIPIDLVFEDGSTVRKQWDLSNEAKLHFVERSEVPISWIKIDPEQNNKLDYQLNNNFMRVELPKTELKRVNVVTVSIIDYALRLFSW
ncbi:M1 family metallopeptidase [Paenibacillus endoradicis]|uniref:M1 family metallopeptidase n=1 Tax=Paenibacillus endoradicis TaxID=2972487 RepID=UPI0021597D6C|nr:M1 family metallopeptidase [Paenibacillus endoradicis]MCR8658893.1 M1 family metallopeptidase [Paenibacillus endoradicis]